MQEHESEIAIVVSNAHNTSFPLVMEPWGLTYEMPPQASYTVVFRSKVPPVPPNTVVIEYAADHITVYGWVGCLFELFQEGEGHPPSS